MESEQGGLKLKAGQERKAAMDRVANGFEQAIRKIVETVSSASSEIEVVASSNALKIEVGKFLETVHAA
jgi:hypothetical protein